MDPRLADGAHDEAVIRNDKNRTSARYSRSSDQESSRTDFDIGLSASTRNTNIDLFGGVVMNRSNGGMNVAAVGYMATEIYGAPGKVVWMPAFDSEIESKPAISKEAVRGRIARR